MKTPTKIFLLFVCMFTALSKTAQCQIVLEQEYDSSAINLYYVKFQINGEKYVKVKHIAQFPGYSNPGQIDIYNLNHTLWKTISLNGIAYDTVFAHYGILYLSDSLFNTDSKIEFMLNVAVPQPQNLRTYIYNEDLVELFSDTTAGILFFNSSVYPDQPAIFNTSLGAKMILRTHYPLYKAKVYSLPGLWNGDKSGSASVTGMQQIGLSAGRMNIYPNPSSEFTTVSYTLPDGIKQADLVFYDLNGRTIKSFKVDDTFHDILLNSGDLISGTYYCSLETNGRILQNKKLIVIK